MPSLFRLLIVLGILVGLGYGTIYVLAHVVQPHPREIIVTVPQKKFYKER
jgi:hypothetical protein